MKAKRIEILKAMITYLEKEVAKVEASMTKAEETMEKALEMAAQCWCDKETRFTTMDPVLAKAFAKRLVSLFERIEQLERSEELAWGLIANAWDLASGVSGWEVAAERWRDNYHATLSPCKE